MTTYIVQDLSLQNLALHVPLERIHPDDSAALHGLLDNHATHGSQQVVFRLMARYGDWQWFELQAHLLASPAQEQDPIRIGVLTDITERQRLAEHAALQKQFLEVLTQSPDRPTLITTMLDTVLGLSDLDGGGLYWERGDGGFDLLASRGLSASFLGQAGNIEPWDPRANIIDAGSMVCSCSLPQDGCTDPGLVHNPSIQAEGILALVVLPITAAGRKHACLNLASKHVQQFPPITIALLQSLAEQFGMAIERLLAREDAQNQRQNLDGFFNALQDFVFVLNPQGEILYVNPAVIHKLGYDDTLLGQSVLVVHPQRVHASAWEIVGEMLHGNRVSCPLPLLKADGSEIMVDTRIVHGNWNGKPALLGVSRDMSTQCGLEQALEKQRDTLRTLIDTIPELVWLKDVSGYYLACNPAFEAFFGHPETDIVGKTDFDFVDAELAQFFRANDQAAIAAGGVNMNEEWITYASDGHRALLSTCKTPMYNRDGKVQGVLGISHDITKQRRTEEALELHQRHLQDLVDERTHELNVLNQRLLSTQFAMECVGIGVHWVNAETGQFITVNQKAAEMIGYEVQEMLQLTVMDIDPNFGRGSFDNIVEDVRNNGHITFETAQRCRDGKDLPMEVSLYYQAGGDLMPPHLIAFQTDITQRKSAEQALIEAKQQAENANERNLLLVQELERANHRLQLNDRRLSATFALSQEAPMLDEAQILQRGIDAAVRLTGSEMGYVHLVDESQVALERQVWSYGTKGQAHATPAAQPTAITPAGKWADPLRTGKAVVHNNYPGLPDTRHSPLPTDSWQRHLGVPVRDGSKIRLLAGVCNKAADYHESDQHNLQDIANDLWSILQRRRTEIELANAKKSAETATVAKSAFLANMSHEIRTPLNAITGMTHLIRRSGVTAEQSERLAKIEMAGSHLLEIINAILDLSKIEAGKFTLEEVSLDVAGIVANVMSILNHQAGARKLEIVVDNQLPMNNFVGDPTRLQQGLLNFGSNAIKFSDKGRVTIRVQMLESSPEAAVLRFEVEDQGIGIEPDTLTRLFSAFEQADNSTTRQYGGTGLGLAITKKLAQLMGGDAGASSTLGAGSTFWFTARLRHGTHAKLNKAPVPSLPAETILARDYSNRQILLVEDDLFNQEISLIILQEIWPVVDLAEDGLQAVEQVRNKAYDLILMDMQMPRMDGLDATRLIRTLPYGAEVPVIAMTGNAFVEDRNRCFDAGMNDFLSKPVNPADLFEVILKWIRR